VHGFDEGRYVAAFGFCAGEGVVGVPCVPSSTMIVSLAHSGTRTCASIRGGSRKGAILPFFSLCCRFWIITIWSL